MSAARARLETPAEALERARAHTQRGDGWLAYAMVLAVLVFAAFLVEALR